VQDAAGKGHDEHIRAVRTTRWLCASTQERSFKD